MRALEDSPLDFVTEALAWLDGARDAIEGWTKQTLDFQILTFDVGDVDYGTCEWEAIASDPYNLAEASFDASDANTDTDVDLSAGDAGLDGLLSDVADACSDAVSHFDEPADACCDAFRICDSGDEIYTYEGNGCTQNIAGTLPIPSANYRRVWSTSGAQCLANDEARSLQFRGPAKAGLRVEVGDDGSKWWTDDSAVVVLLRDLDDEDDRVCVPSFEKSRTTSSYKVSANFRNGLDGKVSRYAVFNPSPSPTSRVNKRWALEVASGQRWGKVFSEESNGYSEVVRSNRHGPIMAMSSSANYGDNHWLLQAHYSSCISTSTYWTSTFSEEKTSNTHCNFGYYVGQLRCTGSRCDNLALKCIKAASSCRVDSNGYNHYKTVYENAEGRCNEGSVVTGMRCYDRYCKTIRIYCSYLTIH